MKYSFLTYVSVISIAVFTTCEQTPTFSSENPLDPESTEYLIPKPNEIKLIYNPTETTIGLDWSQNNEDTSGISGYLIQKSVTTEDNFDSSTIVSKDSIETSYTTKSAYSYREHFYEQFFNYFFSLQSFYVLGQDTLFSEPVVLKYSNEPEITPIFLVTPFKEEKTLTVELFSDSDLKNEILFEIYSITDNDTLLNKEITFPGGSKRIDIEIQSMKPETKYMYRLKKLDTYSSYKTPEVVYEYFPELELINLQSSTDPIIFDIAKTDYNDIYEGEIIFDNYEIEIDKISTDGILVETDTYLITNPSQFETVTISQPDTDYSYKIKLNGYRDEFSISGSSYILDYEVGIKNKYNFTGLFSLNALRADLNDNENKMAVTYADGRFVVYNLQNDIKLYVPVENNDEIQNINFFYPNNREGEHVLTSAYESYITLWDISNNLTAVKADTYLGISQSYKIVDFDIISENEILVLSAQEVHNETYIHLRVTVFDINTKSHRLLMSVNRSNKYSAKVLYNEFTNEVHFASSEYIVNHSELKIYTYNLENEKISVTDIDPFYFENNSFTLSNSGEFIHINDSQTYLRISTSTSQVIYRNSWDGLTYVRNVVGSKYGTEVCTGISREYNTDVECEYSKFNYLSPNQLFNFTMNQEGNRLIIFYQNSYTVVDFGGRWNIIE